MLGEPRAAPTSIHCLLPVTAECPRSAAARSVSRYFGSVEGKIGLHGSMLWTLNFSATCAAKSFNSICCAAGTGLGVFPSQPFHPTMNSRNGYAATATRFRGSDEKCTGGLLRDERATAGTKHTAAATVAHCSTNCLRVTFMRESVAESKVA